MVTTTDHKVIGHLYLITSFAFFLVGGVMALLIRAELAQPGLQIVNEEVYNQLFTMHGTIMLLLFATPLFVGFANVIIPLQTDPNLSWATVRKVRGSSARCWWAALAIVRP
jgi:cytochrome c oxidase subunit I